MKIRSSHGQKPAFREVQRRAARQDAINVPRLFLFLELFVEKEIPGRSTK